MAIFSKVPQNHSRDGDDDRFSFYLYPSLLIISSFCLCRVNPRRFRDGVDLADFYHISVLLRLLFLFLVRHSFLARRERRREIRKRRLNVSL